MLITFGSACLVNNVFSHTSSPELVVLLSELNDAIEHLERKVIPLLSMVLSVFIYLFIIIFFYTV